MNTTDEILQSLAAIAAGRNAPDGPRHRAVLKELMAEARAGGFSRSRELRALVHSARKLAQEAAQHIEPEAADAIIAKHRDTGRPTLAALIDACKSAVRAGSPRPTDESIVTALAHIDHQHRLDHLSRTAAAAAIAELQQRQGEQPEHPLRQLVRQAISEVREHGERLDDQDIGRLLCRIAELHELPPDVCDAIAVIVSEMAIRTSDLDSVDELLEHMRTGGNVG